MDAPNTIINPPLSKNKVKTAGYFIKRLRDNGFVVLKMFAFFSKQDQRTWTILVNPGQASVFITCYQTGLGEFSFELNDGGQYIPRNFSIKTDSIEVIVEYLITHGVTQHEDYPGRYKFISQQINTYSAKKAENTDLPVNSSGEKDNSSVAP